MLNFYIRITNCLKPCLIPMQNIVYIAHSKERDLKRARFSILNLQYFSREIEQRHRIIVYTDSPAYFHDLDVLVEELDNITISTWQGARNSNERLRIMAMRDAFATYHGDVVMVQNETFYIDSPEALFWELSAGSSIMYEEVGPLNCQDSDLPETIECLSAEPYQKNASKALPAPAPGTMLFDMGIIAIHESDRALIKKILCYHDALAPHLGEKLSATLAFSYVLGTQTLLEEGNDWIDLYDKDCRLIDGILQDFFSENEGLPMEVLPNEAWRLAHQFDGSLKYSGSNILEMVKEIIR